LGTKSYQTNLKKHLKITDIVADISNSSPNNMNVNFNPSDNAVDINIAKTQIAVSVHWEYKESFFKEGGSAKVTGPVDSVYLGIKFNQGKKGNFIIPQIAVDDFKLNLDKHKMHLDFKCHHCPGEIEKLIEKFLKDTLISEVTKQIAKQVPSQVKSIGNQMIQQDYPTTFTLYNDIDICTAMTGTIAVKDDHMEVPLDATIFLHPQGYKRQSDAGQMPTYNPKDPGEFMLFINEYLLDTLGSTLNQVVETYTTSIMGITIEAKLDPSKGATKLRFDDGDFYADINPIITIPLVNASISFEATTKLDPKINKGDKENMFFVSPYLKSLKMNKLIVNLNGDSYDISFAADFLNGVIEQAINIGIIPAVPIPKLSSLPLDVCLNMINSQL
jgi:hypothetical protein